jgi:hypothetical protein
MGGEQRSGWEVVTEEKKRGGKIVVGKKKE